MSKKKLFTDGGVTVHLDMPPAKELLRDRGLDPQGKALDFATQEVLNRVQRYMPKRSGAMIGVTRTQTNIRSHEITTDVPYAKKVFYGKGADGQPLHYTQDEGGALRGPRWDQAVEQYEGAAIAQAVQQYLDGGRT